MLATRAGPLGRYRKLRLKYFFEYNAKIFFQRAEPGRGGHTAAQHLPVAVGGHAPAPRRHLHQAEASSEAASASPSAEAAPSSTAPSSVGPAAGRARPPAPAASEAQGTVHLQETHRAGEEAVRAKIPSKVSEIFQIEVNTGQKSEVGSHTRLEADKYR